jgi:ankyrin repeat protein
VSDNRGYRPTHDAVDGRSFKCLDYLLQQEATDINWKSHDGVTTLLLAIRTNQFRLAQLLVSYGADVNIADHMQVTPLLAG